MPGERARTYAHGVRDVLRGWYPPTDDEFKQLWSDSLIVVDASVLLSLYRYTPAARDQLLETFEQLRDRLWLPHQAAMEYQRNRLEVISQQHSAYTKLRSEASQAVERLRGALGAFSRHPSVDVAEIMKEFEAALTNSLSYLDRTEGEAGETKTPQEDSLRDRLTALFDARVGTALSAQDLTELAREGAKRYDAGIPPGYRDRDKPDDRRFGDLIIWEELLRHAAANATDVLFVTDDRKEDWWWIDQGRTIGPRPELVQEFVERTARCFYMYTPDQFLVRSSDSLRRVVSAAVVGEIQAVARESNRRWASAPFGTPAYLEEVQRRRDRVVREIEFLRAGAQNAASGLFDEELQLQREELVADERRTSWRVTRLESELQDAVAKTDASNSGDVRFLREQLAAARARLERLRQQLTHAIPGANEEYRRARLMQLEHRLAGYEDEIAYLADTLPFDEE